jgi:hypothetical protein
VKKVQPILDFKKMKEQIRRTSPRVPQARIKNLKVHSKHTVHQLREANLPNAPKPSPEEKLSVTANKQNGQSLPIAQNENDKPVIQMLADCESDMDNETLRKPKNNETSSLFTITRIEPQSMTSESN